MLPILLNILLNLLSCFNIKLSIKDKNVFLSRYQLFFKVLFVLVKDFTEEKLPKKYSNFQNAEDFVIILRDSTPSNLKAVRKIKSNSRKRRCRKRKVKIRNGKFGVLKNEYKAIVTKQAKLSRIYAVDFKSDEEITDPKGLLSKRLLKAEIDTLIKRSDKVLHRIVSMKDRRKKRRSAGLDKSYERRRQLRLKRSERLIPPALEVKSEKVSDPNNPEGLNVVAGKLVHPVLGFVRYVRTVIKETSTGYERDHRYVSIDESDDDDDSFGVF